MLFFNIHNIFKFSLKGKILPRLEKFFCQELGYFKTKETSIDLEIEFVSEIPDPAVVFYPNSGRDKDYFYTRDYLSNKVGILSASKIIAESKISPGFLLEDIIEPLILINILGKGYSFLHASAVSKDNKSLIFSAFPKAGKTNLAVLLLKSGYSFLANELVFLSEKGIVLPYPRPISVYSYNIKSVPEIADTISGDNFFEKQKINLLSFMSTLQNSRHFKYPRSLFAKAGHLILREIVGKSFPLDPGSIGSKTGASSNLDKVFLLFTDGSLDKPEIKELKDKKVLAGQLWINILREKNKFFTKIASAYGFGFPEKRTTIKDNNLKLGEKIIYNGLNKARCFQLTIPEKAPFKEVFQGCQKYFH